MKMEKNFLDSEGDAAPSRRAQGAVRPNQNFSGLSRKIRAAAKRRLSRERFEHSARVAKTARALCKKYGVDPSAGYLAGVAHDICKSLDDKAMLETAALDGKPIGALEKSRPALLHGRAAAVTMAREFGVNDKSVLNAVAVHTFGARGMDSLAKIVYIADKIEPGRPFVTKEYKRSIARLDLDALLLKVVSEGVSHLSRKGSPVSPETQALLDDLRGR